jgi:hypothetical protein
MKRILFYVLTLTIFLACNYNDKKQVAKILPINSERNFKKNDTTIPFSGFYINENYLATIQKTKSPRKAQETSDEISFVIIPDMTNKETELIFNFHEGSPPLTIVNNNNKYELWTFENNKATEFNASITVDGNNKIKINGKTLVKVCDFYDTDRFDGGIILKELLFKGKYSSEKGDNVEFKRNGQVIGLDGLKYYSPITDYYDNGMQIDMVRLGQTKEKTENFGFKFQGDTLFIHKVKCIDSSNNECNTVDYGELIYKLIKQK